MYMFLHVRSLIRMPTYLFFACFLLFQLAEGDSKSQLSGCPKEFTCGNLGNVSFPFSNNNASRPECGLYSLSCKATPYPTITLGQHQYGVQGILGDLMLLFDPHLDNLLRKRSYCNIFNTTTFSSLPTSASISFQFIFHMNFYKCNSSSNVSLHKINDDYFAGYKRYNSCENFTLYYTQAQGGNRSSINIPAECSVIQLPIGKSSKASDDLFGKLNSSFVIQWKVSENCAKCHYNGGQCQTDTNNNFRCSEDAEKKKAPLFLRITFLVGVTLILLGPSAALVIFLWRRKKGHNGGSSLSQLSPQWDLEGCSNNLGVHVFSYSQLQKATDYFHSAKELGDGGFGTVYHGKLLNGREVAVKRLYEHNYKRMEQFMNEIKILARLRHHNLVTLYGCTSRHSRELLLVYEYVPNGTVADHLHGKKSKNGSLAWPIRMNIAVETATALAYLHASDIIHRDVKTTNILLDNNFCVKVGDFGLSRILPSDVTHVSTAPQGTPGYVDPEYHECYQLTDKSDVYSFGVVLVELISSMLAVDTSRHRDEINLANLAVNKILTRAFNELIDPSLEIDVEIMRMIISVAELAFQCLQPKKDMRPTMDNVLETLKEIQGRELQDETKMEMPLSPESEDVVLLKKIVRFPTSPTSVTDRWVNGSTATSNSL